VYFSVQLLDAMISNVFVCLYNSSVLMFSSCFHLLGGETQQQDRSFTVLHNDNWELTVLLAPYENKNTMVTLC